MALALTQRHLNIPEAVAAGYRRLGVRGRLLEELEGHCRVALVRAWRSFDPAKGASLETHLLGWVRLAARAFWRPLRAASRRVALAGSPLTTALEARLASRHDGLGAVDARDWCEAARKMLGEGLWRPLWMRHALGAEVPDIALAMGLARCCRRSVYARLDEATRRLLEWEEGQP